MKEVLARRLKECRKQRGLTQMQVAVYCDITEKAYQNYELMTREPKLEILARIADGLSCRQNGKPGGEVSDNRLHSVCFCDMIPSN